MRYHELKCATIALIQAKKPHFCHSRGDMNAIMELADIDYKVDQVIIQNECICIPARPLTPGMLIYSESDESDLVLCRTLLLVCALDFEA